MVKMPLVLLCGLLSTERVWRHQTSHLADVAEIRVIASDEDTPEKMVRSILERAPSRFALAGHSMGGWLSLEVMKSDPSRVSKLFLLNTSHKKDSEEKRQKRKKMIGEAQEGCFNLVAKELAEKFVYNPELRAEMEKMFLNVGKETFIRQESAMLKRESASILPSIRCPTFVVHAAEDKIFSLEDHQDLAAGIPGARLTVIEDSGHMSPIEMPQAITALMRLWLTGF